MCRCVSRAVFVVAVICAAAAAHAQTVDEIVAKNLQAKGGAEKWKSVNSVKMTGKVSLQGINLEVPLTVYAKRPNYNRQEIVLKDKQLVQAFDGTTAWYINPIMGSDVAQETPAAQAEMMKNGADFDGALINYKSKGHTIEFVGKEKLAASEVYHLKLTMKNGHVTHYYLDATSGIELENDRGGRHRHRHEAAARNRAVELPADKRHHDSAQHETVDRWQDDRPDDDRQGRIQRPRGRRAIQDAEEITPPLGFREVLVQPGGISIPPSCCTETGWGSGSALERCLWRRDVVRRRAHGVAEHVCGVARHRVENEGEGVRGAGRPRLSDVNGRLKSAGVALVDPPKR